MNILIFGRDGQLGRAFASLFKNMPSSENAQITCFGRDQCDLSEEAQVISQLETVRPTLIINAAAYTAVDKAETEVELAYAVNAKAPEIMARYAAENNATLVHYSTDYVFDGSKADFYVESDARNPLGVYGKSKAAGEMAIEKAFANSLKGRFVIFRTSWVYGDGGNFIRTMLRLAKEREELKVIHDQYGVPTSAEWLAKVSLDLVLDSNINLKQFESGIYHAVPDGQTTWHGLASFAIQAALNAGVKLKVRSEAIKPVLAIEYPLPAPRPMSSRMNSAKLRAALQIGSKEASKSYNVIQNMPNFPAWDGMVYEYVSNLASKGLI